MSVRRFLPRLEKKFAGLTVETIAEDGSFSGYASLFGEVDLGKDAIEAGAFEKSVRERGAAGTTVPVRSASFHRSRGPWLEGGGTHSRFDGIRPFAETGHE